MNTARKSGNGDKMSLNQLILTQITLNLTIMSENFNLSYHIHYSKEYKLYDIVIKKDGEFYKHYHLPTKKEVIKLIKF